MESLYRLHILLDQFATHRHPLTKQKLLEALECSDATFKRLLVILREQFGYSINYDRKRNGYYLDEDSAFSVPGLWFGAGELHALLLSRQLLNTIQPGGLDEHFQALASRVDSLLEATTGQSPAIACSRIRVLPMAQSLVPRDIFLPISRAVLQGKRVVLGYCDIDGVESAREVSPQRLVYYRDNWYLDAWCHLREALRVFWLAGVRSLSVLEIPVHAVSDEEMASELESAYGIFTGQAKRVAHLRFTGHAAMRVRHARWHPEQRLKINSDGSVELWVPYGVSRELIMDVMRYGEEVMVLGPKQLKKDVQKRLEKTLSLYFSG